MDSTSDKSFFEGNKDVFERSVFNFNQSFAAKIGLEVDSDEENTVTDTVVNSIAQKEEEKGQESQQMLDSMGSFDFDDPGYHLGLLDYEHVETKLAEKMKNKDAEFDEKWEQIEADKAVAAQMSRKRQDRQRKQSNGKKEKEEAGVEDIPRLFLFEGEKLSVGKKKKRKKKTKKLRKLDNKLSKEFRKAMKDIFESDSEESYDKTFGEASERVAGPKSSRRFSMAESSDGESVISGNSRASEPASENFDDDYLRRLKEKSMQREVKEMLYESQRSQLSKKSEGSDDQSVVSKSSEVSRPQSRMPLRTDSVSSFAKQRRKKRKGRVRRNRSGELVGPGIDPADVYAKEVEKSKTRKTFSIAELRKEMEDMKQTSFGGFEQTAAAKMKSFKNPTMSPKTPSTSKPKKGFLQRLTKTPSRSPGPETLVAMTPEGARPGLGNRQTSFATTTSNQGLLNTNRTGFEIGGNLAAPPTIDEGDEEAFLTGGNNGPNEFDHSVRSRSIRPGLASVASTFFKSGGFTTPRRMSKPTVKKTISSKQGMSAGLPSGPLPGGSLPTGPLPTGPMPTAPLPTGAGGLGGTGFQEPLPLPEMQDDGSKKKRGLNLGKFAGKMKRMAPKMSFGRKNQGQDLNALGDDDSDEGGMGLLG